MRAVNHGLVGAAIAVSARQPLIAVPLAYLSHYACDALPHSDVKVFRSKKFWIVLYGDMALAIASTLAVAWAWHQMWWLIIICAFAAASPDLTWLYYRFMNTKIRHDVVTRFHGRIQWAQMDSLLGYGIEIIWFIVFFSALIYFGSK